MTKIEDKNNKSSRDLTAKTATLNAILCKHCGVLIDETRLIGFSLVCPLCGKPQNGHQKDPIQNPYNDVMVVCKHCGEQINQVQLRGISLLCPLCGKPQNGALHKLHINT